MKRIFFIISLALMVCGICFAQDFIPILRFKTEVTDTLRNRSVKITEASTHDIFWTFTQDGVGMPLTNATQVLFIYEDDAQTFSQTITGSVDSATNAFIRFTPDNSNTNGTFVFALTVGDGTIVFARSIGELRLEHQAGIGNTNAFPAGATNINWLNFNYQNTASSGPYRAGTNILFTSNADGSENINVLSDTNAITTLLEGTNITITGTGTNRTVSHSNTSDIASIDNSDGTVVQDITFDGHGHATAGASTNLDLRYLQSASNLSDLVSTAEAVTNLGLVINTDVQAFDSDLDTFAAQGEANYLRLNRNNTTDDNTTNMFDNTTIRLFGGREAANQTITAADTIQMTNLVILVEPQASITTITNVPNLSAPPSDGGFYFAAIHNADMSNSIVIQDSANLTNSQFEGDGVDLELLPEQTVWLFWEQDETNWHLATLPSAVAAITDVTLISVRNETGSSISKGQPVAFAGFSGSRILIQEADADVTGAMPAIGMMNANINNNQNKNMAIAGIVKSLDTTSFTTGVVLYVSTDPSTTLGLTATKPTGVNDQIQAIAMSVRSGAGNGQFLLIGADQVEGESNEIVLRNAMDANEQNIRRLGNLTFDGVGDGIIAQSNKTQRTLITGGSVANDRTSGAYLTLGGVDDDANAGDAILAAGTNGGLVQLISEDGTLGLTIDDNGINAQNNSITNIGTNSLTFSDESKIIIVGGTNIAWIKDSITNILSGAEQSDIDFLNGNIQNNTTVITNSVTDIDRNESNIGLNTFRTIINGSLTFQNLIDGVSDEYEDETGIDTGASTGESFDSGNSLYQNLGSTPFRLQIQGAAERVDVANEADYDNVFDGTTPFTFAYWLSTPTFGSSTHSVWSKGQDPTFTGVLMNSGPGNNHNLIIKNGGVGNNIDVRSVVTPVDSNTAHFVWRYDGNSNASGVRLSINAVTQAMTIAGDNFSGNMLNNTQLKIGGGLITGSFQSDFEMDELLIFDRELSDTEVTNLFANGGQFVDTNTAPGNSQLLLGYHFDEGSGTTVIDFSTNGNDGTHVGTLTYFTGTNALAPATNMTLQSNTFDADAVPTSVKVIVLYEEVDPVGLNTDLIYTVSSDGFTNEDSIVLSAKGIFTGNIRIAIGTNTLTGASTNMGYKVFATNNSSLKIHGTSILWK